LDSSISFFRFFLKRVFQFRIGAVKPLIKPNNDRTMRLDWERFEVNIEVRWRLVMGPNRTLNKRLEK